MDMVLLYHVHTIPIAILIRIMQLLNACGVHTWRLNYSDMLDKSEGLEFRNYA
jgi:hypothetical protein